MYHTEFFYRCACCGYRVSSFYANTYWDQNTQWFICNMCNHTGIIAEISTDTTTSLPYLTLQSGTLKDILV